MTEYIIKLVELGFGLDEKVKGKLYYDYEGIRYEIQPQGKALTHLSQHKLLQLADMAKENLEHMQGSTLEIRVNIKEVSE